MFYDGEIGIQYWRDELYGLPMPVGWWSNRYGPLLTSKCWRTLALIHRRKPGKSLKNLHAPVTEGDALGLDVMAVNVGTNDASFVSWLYTNGGKYVSDDGRTLEFNSPEGVQTLEFMLTIVNDVYGGIENVTDFNQDVSFADGDHPWYDNQQPIFMSNTSMFGHFNTNAGEWYADPDAWGVMLRPYNGDNPDAGHAGVVGYGFSGGLGPIQFLLFIPPEVQAAAYEFAEYLGTNELGGCAFLFAQNRPSPVRACNENPAYYDANPHWGTVLESLATDVSVPIAPVQGQIAEILNNSIEEAFFGVKTAEEALNEAAEEGQAILDEFWSSLDG